MRLLLKSILPLCVLLAVLACGRSAPSEPPPSPRTIVVIGSSTAEGAGASTPDSSWVGRYRTALRVIGRGDTVVNLARGGYTSLHLLPTGTPTDPAFGIAVDTARNISAALRQNPDVVIVNLPSNDAAYGVSVAQQLRNFRTIDSVGRAGGAEVYVATTQPRNFEEAEQVTTQLTVRDAILLEYGGHAIDFWTDLAERDGRIDQALDSGDGVHVNDRGHAALSKRVLEAVE